MANLPQIEVASLFSDRLPDPHNPSYWFVSVHYFGGGYPGEIATFPTDQEDKAVAFYQKTLAEAKASDQIKEVMLCHAMPTFHPKPTEFFPKGQYGRSTVIGMWEERSRRKGKWTVRKGSGSLVSRTP
jgi:hypothetical protein